MSTIGSTTANRFTFVNGSNSAILNSAALTSSYTLSLPASSGTGALYNTGSNTLTWNNTFLTLVGTPAAGSELLKFDSGTTIEGTGVLNPASGQLQCQASTSGATFTALLLGNTATASASTCGIKFTSIASAPSTASLAGLLTFVPGATNYMWTIGPAANPAVATTASFAMVSYYGSNQTRNGVLTYTATGSTAGTLSLSSGDTLTLTGNLIGNFTALTIANAATASGDAPVQLCLQANYNGTPFVEYLTLDAQAETLTVQNSTFVVNNTLVVGGISALAGTLQMSSNSAIQVTYQNTSSWDQPGTFDVISILPNSTEYYGLQLGQFNSANNLNIVPGFYAGEQADGYVTWDIPGGTGHYFTGSIDVAGGITSNGLFTVGLDVTSADETAIMGFSIAGSNAYGLVTCNHGTIIPIYFDCSIVSAIDAAQTCGSSGHRWSAVWAQSGTIQTSDRSQKRDIVPIQCDALGIINEISPRQYKFHPLVQESRQPWKKHGKVPTVAPDPRNETHFGFMADEIKATLIKYGVTEHDGFIVEEAGQPVGMNYSNLLPFMWLAIQKLSARCDELEQVSKK